MYTGWMSFGGSEVVNTERTRGYSETATPGAFWHRGDRVPLLDDFLGDADYVADNLPFAPWYDPSAPDLSQRFYGVSGILCSGIDDSTHTRDIVQTTFGGVQGTVGESVKSVRWQVMLTAAGPDALEYGTSWLKNVLNNGRCGEHGVSCGVGSMEYLAAPPMDELPHHLVETAGAVTRRNYVTDPHTKGTGWTAATPSTTTVAYVPTGAQDGGSAFVATTTTSDNAIRLRMPMQTAQAQAGGYVTVAADVYRSTAGSGTMEVSFTTTGGQVWVNGGYVPLPAGWSRLVQKIKVPSTLSVGDWNFAQFVGGDTAPAIGSVFKISRATAEVGQTDGSYFDGGSTATTKSKYAWAGTANASASTETTRIFTDAIDWATFRGTTGRLSRYLHEVSVTSGPFVVDEYEVGDIVGRTVEFTLTATSPFVYATTDEIEVATRGSSVIEDAPINLVPYPSAELAGAPVVVSTNYAKNPSVATGTGWNSDMSNAGNGTGSATTSTVVASNGTTSWLSRWLANGTAGSGTGRTMRGFYDVDVTTLSTGQRVGFSIWSLLNAVGTGTVLKEWRGFVEWRDTNGNVLRTDITGASTAYSGNVFTADNLPVPAGATVARCGVRVIFDWASGSASVNTDVQLYVDAVALTNP
jgi:hypothetical protein